MKRKSKPVNIELQNVIAKKYKHYHTEKGPSMHISVGNNDLYFFIRGSQNIVLDLKQIKRLKKFLDKALNEIDERIADNIMRWKSKKL